MHIDDLINELTKIKEVHGNIPIYNYEIVNGRWGEYHHELCEFVSFGEVETVYTETYFNEYYCNEIDDIVSENVTKYDSTRLGNNVPSDAENIHKGLIIY